MVTGLASPSFVRLRVRISAFVCLRSWLMWRSCKPFYSWLYIVCIVSVLFWCLLCLSLSLLWYLMSGAPLWSASSILVVVVSVKDGGARVFWMLTVCVFVCVCACCVILVIETANSYPYSAHTARIQQQPRNWQSIKQIVTHWLLSVFMNMTNWRKRTIVK
jgi:hypothetical protein